MAHPILNRLYYLFTEFAGWNLPLHSFIHRTGKKLAGKMEDKPHFHLDFVHPVFHVSVFMLYPSKHPAIHASVALSSCEKCPDHATNT